jgi:LysM repeat protein
MDLHQIRFNDENLGGQGIATIAVTNKDNQGYYLVALAPAQEWNATQPTFQGMINSFRFGAETVVAAKASETPKAGPTKAATADKDATPEKEGTARATAEKTPTPSPSPSPTPQAAATPLVYAIQSGDSLLEIANKFGVDVNLLTEENGITNPSGLQIGQELIIPFTAEQLAEYNAKNGVTSVASANKGTVSPTARSEAADGTPTAKTTPAETAEEPAEAEPTKEAASAAPVSGRIVYPAYINNMYDVWMVDLGSMEQTPIAGTASQPAFNKDGSLLAYRSWDKGTRGIFFRDFIGGRGGIVTRFVEDGLPSWTPDGSFAFSSRKEGDRVPRIYLGNQQGDQPYAVGFQGEYVSVMPNGQLIAKGCTPSGDCGLYVMGPRGGGEKKISSETSDTAPAPSPDGTKLA